MSLKDINGRLLGSQAEPIVDKPEGPLNYRVSSSKDGLVRLDFSRPVTWMAMRAEEAKRLAEVFLRHANTVEGRQI